MFNTGKLFSTALLAASFICSSLASAMDDVETVLAERACQRLALLYSHYIDQGQASKVADLFTEDGVWRYANQRFEGRAELRRFFEERETMTHRLSRHLITNHVVNVLDENNAVGVLYFVHLQDNTGEDGTRALQGQPRMVGQYEDVYIRTGGEWRIKSRVASAQFTMGETE